MVLQTSPEKPAPVRVISNAIHGWISRLGFVWVEGQITQLTRRPGTQTVFLILRDIAADVSIQITCPRRVFDTVDPPVTDGARVIVHARPAYYMNRGSLSLAADDIRPIGLGELLARLEQRRRLLAAEGLFAAERKRRLPFLPDTVGLICGRDSAAERDVVENARRRWPAVRFETRNVAVQGPNAAADVIGALQSLDRLDQVDVIVVSRGGGSAEDLLPFSDEGLLRAVFAAHTPVISAIGHEQDSPLLDLVADHRASTPTDAGRTVVPDMAAESRLIAEARSRARSAVTSFLDRELEGLAGVRRRPIFADPMVAVTERATVVAELTDRARRCMANRLDRAADDIAHRLARVRTLSPLATLKRGYAVLQTTDGSVITDAAAVSEGDLVDARLAAGRMSLQVQRTEPE
ncbi:MAG: exodeoxyribonuclease VII large subunit [Nocardioidaceae bacterium]